MPKTVVSALYNFRDVKGKQEGAEGAEQNETCGGRGGEGGGRGRRKGSCSSASTLPSENKHSDSASRRYLSLTNLAGYLTERNLCRRWKQT